MELKEEVIIMDEFEKRLDEIIKKKECVPEWNNDSLIISKSIRFSNGVLLSINVINGNKEKKTPAYIDATWRLGDDAFSGNEPDGLLGSYILKGDETDITYVAELISKPAFYRFDINDIVSINGELMEVWKITDECLLLDGFDGRETSINDVELELVTLVCKAHNREDV